MGEWGEDLWQLNLDAVKFVINQNVFKDPIQVDNGAGMGGEEGIDPRVGVELKEK